MSTECLFCREPATHYVDYTNDTVGYDCVCEGHAGPLSERMENEEPQKTNGLPEGKPTSPGS